MKVRCIWEHKGQDTLLYAEHFVGAFTRGSSLERALQKMPAELQSYLAWKGAAVPTPIEPEIVQEKASDLDICDADSDVLFETERGALTPEEYTEGKAPALRSAKDFLCLYEAVPDKHTSCLPPRKTFYGPVPRTAFEMYEHTKNVNGYYFGEISVDVGNEGTILTCREKGFALLEQQPGFLENAVFTGSYQEQWSLRKVLRRFVWHDRIHAKAMYRMAVKTFGEGSVPDVFRFARPQALP